MIFRFKFENFAKDKNEKTFVINNALIIYMHPESKSL